MLGFVCSLLSVARRVVLLFVACCLMSRVRWLSIVRCRSCVASCVCCVVGCKVLFVGSPLFMFGCGLQFLVRVCCVLIVFVVCWFVFVGRCSRSVAVVGCGLVVVLRCSQLLVVRCWVFVVCCLLCVSLVSVRCLRCDVSCMLFVVCRV